VKKESTILIVVVCLLVGFVVGVGAGIKYASREQHPSQGELIPPSANKTPSPDEIHALERVLKRDPNNLQSLIDLGNRYFDAQAFQKAIDLYARALAIDPGNPDVRTDMAVMYRGLKDYDRAVKELEEAAFRNPKHVNSRYNLGVILLHDKKDIKGAMAAWEDCLKAGATGEQAERIRQQLSALKDLSR
jgi:cytochrome c-type biogenesis protein CcmH/NrfG